MRPMPLVTVASIVFLSGMPAAQGWIEYQSQADFFVVNFPGQPTVRDITYPTEYGITLPGRIHIQEGKQGRYSVTVVDYANVQKIHAERLKGCQGYPDVCANPWVAEMRGALDHAVWKFLQGDAKVTHYAYANTDRVEGRRIQLLNADRSRTFIAVYMHENRLYILDGTAPAGVPPPALFQQSLGFLDKDGIRVRYMTIYANSYPPPPREETRGRAAGC